MFRRSCRALFHEFKATLVDTQVISPTTRWLRFDTDELKHDTISSVFARITTADGAGPALLSISVMRVGFCCWALHCLFFLTAFFHARVND